MYNSNMKISNTSIKYYIDEKLSLMERDIKKMREQFDKDNAYLFVDNFGAIQYHEMAMISAVKELMNQLNFSEKDLMMQNIKEYKEDWFKCINIFL